jgi:membrane-associated phospholipid phosphatase
MSGPAGIGASSNYFAQLSVLTRRSLAQLVQPPSHVRRAVAARRMARTALLLATIVGIVIVALMVALDAREIALMPARGTASLWPVRILTDFGRAALVLWALAAALFTVTIVAPLLHGTARSRLLDFGTRLRFLFFAVLVPILAGELIKWVVGRGRPFVGGEANAFNFVHFAGTEAYASFPSAHAVTSVALAFAVTAVWPRAGLAMSVYAILIVMSRLVLLAHHPSDVVAGALIAVVGAMAVRYWFAARHLGFDIAGNGAIVPLAGHAPRRLKRVAREPSAP